MKKWLKCAILSWKEFSCVTWIFMFTAWWCALLNCASYNMPLQCKYDCYEYTWEYGLHGDGRKMLMIAKMLSKYRTLSLRHGIFCTSQFNSANSLNDVCETKDLTSLVCLLFWQIWSYYQLQHTATMISVDNVWTGNWSAPHTHGSVLFILCSQQIHAVTIHY